MADEKQPASQKSRYRQRRDGVERERSRVVPAVLRPMDVLVFGYVGSESELLRKRRAGDFPKAIKLGDHSIGWRREDLEEWLSTRERVS